VRHLLEAWGNLDACIITTERSRCSCFIRTAKCLGLRTNGFGNANPKAFFGVYAFTLATAYIGRRPGHLGLLTSEVFTRSRGLEEPMRYAGLAMCGIFVLGLLLLPFLPETKRQPLPQ
jgi:hypothetical protein